MFCTFPPDRQTISVFHPPDATILYSFLLPKISQNCIILFFNCLMVTLALSFFLFSFTQEGRSNSSSGCLIGRPPPCSLFLLLRPSPTNFLCSLSFFLQSLIDFQVVLNAKAASASPYWLANSRASSFMETLWLLSPLTLTGRCGAEGIVEMND